MAPTPLVFRCVFALVGVLNFQKESQHEADASLRDGDEKIPVCFDISRKRRYFWNISSLIVHLITLGLMGFLGEHYLRYFGKAQDVIHFISYFLTFWTLLMSVMVSIISANVIKRFYLLPTKDEIYWWLILYESYVSRRWHFFRYSRVYQFKYLIFGLFMTWATINNTLQITYYIMVKDVRCHAVRYLGHMGNIFIFATFCYFLLILRISLQAESKTVVLFIRQNIQDLDKCYERLSQFCRDYLRFKSFIRPWMNFVLSLAILGLTVHCAWTYGSISTIASPLSYNATLIPQPNNTMSKFIVADTMIFSEKLMLPVLALFAIGGVDVKYIWLAMKRSLSCHRESFNELKWRKLMRFHDHLHPDTTGEAFISVALSLVGFGLGIELSKQDLDYSTVP